MAEKSFADEISKAAARLETEEADSGKAVTKMRYAGEDVGETSELEDKYCSLCGSMIKEDGSCPMCGVPTFISGNGRAGNQKLHRRQVLMRHPEGRKFGFGRTALNDRRIMILKLWRILQNEH